MVTSQTLVEVNEAIKAGKLETIRKTKESHGSHLKTELIKKIQIQQISVTAPTSYHLNQ